MGFDFQFINVMVSVHLFLLYLMKHNVKFYFNKKEIMTTH